MGKYPIDYDSFMEEAKEAGLEADDDVKHFVKEVIDNINDAYYQGRLDETMNRI